MIGGGVGPRPSRVALRRRLDGLEQDARVGIRRAGRIRGCRRGRRSSGSVGGGRPRRDRFLAVSGARIAALPRGSGPRLPLRRGSQLRKAGGVDDPPPPTSRGRSWPCRARDRIRLARGGCLSLLDAQDMRQHLQGGEVRRHRPGDNAALHLRDGKARKGERGGNRFISFWGHHCSNNNI